MEVFPEAEHGSLIWSDEFDYTGLTWIDMSFEINTFSDCRCAVRKPFTTAGAPDPLKWSCELGDHGWGNGELQAYTDDPSNVWVSEGALHIKARRQSLGQRNYTSARLSTEGKADWQYGRIEVRLRLPAGRGTWAAAWMLPTNNKFGDCLCVARLTSWNM